MSVGAQPAVFGKTLSDEIRVKMESAFDMDLCRVRIHEGSEASALGALAYTQGTDIHFAVQPTDP